MEKGQRVQIRIEDQTSEGQGVGKNNGFAVFVAGAVVGDLIMAELTKVKKNYAFGRLVEILEPSEDRIEAMCEYTSAAGGTVGVLGERGQREEVAGHSESLEKAAGHSGTSGATAGKLDETVQLDKAAGHPGTTGATAGKLDGTVQLDKAAGHSPQCGGCPYGSLSYDAQLRIKENQVREKLSRLGGLSDPLVRPIIGMEHPFRYRNKASMPVWAGGIVTRKGGIMENLGEPVVGFYKGKSHDVVNCHDCMLQSEPAMAAAEALRRFMKEDNITAYDPKWEKGLMRHLVVKTAHSTGEVMVILAVNGKGIPNAEKLVEMLDDAIYNVAERTDGFPAYSLESVVVNVKKKKTPEIMGDECITIAGKPTILEKAGGLTFEISPLSFYQVNPEQMEVLFDKAMEYAQLTGTETVLDLYCGVGTIGLFAAKAGAAKVIGIESVKSAVMDANRNAVVNGITSARYVCGRAEEELPKLLGKEEPKDENFDADGEPEESIDNETPLDLDDGLKVDHADVVFLDPPRAGCDERLLEAVVTAKPERIVYVSCDPATLARDVKFLTGNGYEFAEATPVDMFPWTGHVETVCLLSKLKSTTISK